MKVTQSSTLLYKAVVILIFSVLFFTACDELANLNIALEAPTGLAAAAGDSQVTLTWTPSSDTSVTGYKIRQTAGDVVTSINILNRAAKSHTITGLTNGTAYSFAISAVAESGEGLPSESVTATPAALTEVPKVPTGLAAAAGDSQVTLTWTASSDTSVTGYKIRQTAGDVVTSINIPNRAAKSHTITGLTNGQSYSFTIAAVAGSTESVQSTAVTAAPAPKVEVPVTPAAPTGLTAAAGNGEVTLTWTASSDTSVTGYKIRQTVDGTEIEIDVMGRTTTTHTAAGLANRAYSFTISAVTESTESVPSEAVTATPAAPIEREVPIVLVAPTGLTAAVGDGHVTLTWTASTNVRVTGYKIRQIANNVVTSINVSHRETNGHTITGLTNGKAYSFTISAVAGNTESVQSEPLAITPTAAPIEIPEVPIALEAPTEFAATPGNGEVTLTWAASTNVRVTGYRIRQTVGRRTRDIDVNRRETEIYTVTGLRNSRVYSFTISAVTGSAESVQSEAVIAIPIAPIERPVVTATAGYNSVILTWDAVEGAVRYNVSQDGVRDYHYYSTTSKTVTGLNAGQEYTFAVTAENEAGEESAFSSEVKARPMQLSIPTGLTAESDRYAARLSWNAVEGAASYYVYKNGSYLSYTGSTSYTVKNLRAGQQYTFTVKAYAHGGYSASSGSVRATPTALSAPTGLTALTGYRSIVLVWNAVEGAASYGVYKDGIHVSSTSSASKTFYSLNAGQEYTFTVKACVNSGCSDESSAVKMTPQ